MLSCRLQVRVAELQQQLSAAQSSSSEDSHDNLAMEGGAGEGAGTGGSNGGGGSKGTLTLQLVVSELREELQRQSDLTRSETLLRQKTEALLREANASLQKEVQQLC